MHYSPLLPISLKVIFGHPWHHWSSSLGSMFIIYFWEKMFKMMMLQEFLGPPQNGQFFSSCTLHRKPLAYFDKFLFRKWRKWNLRADFKRRFFSPAALCQAKHRSLGPRHCFGGGAVQKGALMSQHRDVKHHTPTSIGCALRSFWSLHLVVSGIWEYVLDFILSYFIWTFLAQST